MSGVYQVFTWLFLLECWLVVNQDLNEQVQEGDQDQDSTQYEESKGGSDADSNLGDQPDPSRYSVARDR